MFYINEYDKRSGTTKRVVITPDNVDTLCPVCGCQFKVNLNEVFADQGENDLSATRVLCSDCAKTTLEKLGADVGAGDGILVKIKDRRDGYE